MHIPDKSLKMLRVRSTLALLLACVFLMLAAEVVAWRVQTNGGQVEVSNVTYPNYNGIPIRAKLFRHTAISAGNPGPGAVYTHGYQNNRETSDAYCIEMARRGFVMLCINAIGRGNSGNPNDVLNPSFDPSYGVRTSPPNGWISRAPCRSFQMMTHSSATPTAASRTAAPGGFSCHRSSTSWNRTTTPPSPKRLPG